MPPYRHFPMRRLTAPSLPPQLTLVQENLKYYLELRQHQKSDTLEWVNSTRPATLDCSIRGAVSFDTARGQGGTGA